MSLRITLICLAVAGAACACGPRGGAARPYPEPAPDVLVAAISAQHEAALSFRAKTVMDYWTGKERVKGTVWIMGERTAKVRFNALSPTGNNVAVDLACDGFNYKYLNYNDNCQLTGPCNADSIARLLRISMQPDDFLLLAMGTVPMPDSPRATLSWDGSRGVEVLTLTAPDGWVQTVNMRESGGLWEIAGASLRDPSGELDWEVENRDFTTITGEDGTQFRVPKRTRLQQQRADADLIVRWDERTMNPDIDDDKYDFDIPSGLPICK